MSQQSKLIKGMSKKQNPTNIVVTQTLVQKQKIKIQRPSNKSPSQEKTDEKD
jgi:hypothetical protein